LGKNPLIGNNFFGDWRISEGRFTLAKKRGLALFFPAGFLRGGLLGRRNWKPRNPRLIVGDLQAHLGFPRIWDWKGDLFRESLRNWDLIGLKERAEFRELLFRNFFKWGLN